MGLCLSIIVSVSFREIEDMIPYEDNGFNRSG